MSSMAQAIIIPKQPAPPAQVLDQLHLVDIGRQDKRNDLVAEYYHRFPGLFKGLIHAEDHPGVGTTPPARRPRRLGDGQCSQAQESCPPSRPVAATSATTCSKSENVPGCGSANKSGKALNVVRHGRQYQRLIRMPFDSWRR